MKTNALPAYDRSDNPTNCCPRFNPQGWDGQELHFEDKLFVRARTVSLFHVPLNMGSVFAKTFAAIEAAGAIDEKQFIVLSRDLSPWSTEHCFAVTKNVAGLEMCRLSGDYLTKVFEGPFSDAPLWRKALETFVAGRRQKIEKSYFFYTTCPKCAKVYGKNYVVAVGQVQAVAAAAAG